MNYQFSDDVLALNPKLKVPVAVTPSKYHAQRTEYGGQVYHSKKEAQYAEGLDLRKATGDLDFYLTQVPIRLPGGVVYRLDFLEFKRDRKYILYEIRLVEVKGHRVQTGEVKRKIAEAVLGLKIEVV